MPNPIDYGIQSPQVRGAAYFGDLARQTLEDSIQRNNEIKLSTYLDSFLNPEMAATPFGGQPTTADSPSAPRRPPPLRSLFAPHEWDVMKKRRPEVVAGDTQYGIDNDLERDNTNAAILKMLAGGMKIDDAMTRIAEHQGQRAWGLIEPKLRAATTREEVNAILSHETAKMPAPLRQKLILDATRLASEKPLNKELVDSKAGEIQGEIETRMRGRRLSEFDDVSNQVMAELGTGMDPVTRGQVQRKLFSASGRVGMISSLKAIKDQETGDVVEPFIGVLSQRLVNATSPDEGRKAYNEVRATVPAGYQMAFDKAAKDQMSGFLRGSDVERRGDTGSFNRGMTLKRQFGLIPAVQAYQTVSMQYDIMDSALKEAATNPGNFVFVDQALIMTFNKMLDYKSVVRESEYARTPEDMAWVSRIRGAASRVMSGGRLAPDERQAAIRIAQQFLSAAEKQYRPFESQYRREASRIGADPEFVVLPDLATTPETVRGGGGGGSAPARTWNPKTKQWE